ncbi:ribosome-binding protein [Schistosoma haematobium]|uniref:60S ribosomal export protein NMD3 n=1 Tax=Schistosoma haematobium TaxID=6185 RepID=A0A922S537_SCHHA|nr:ribosome-binding protein [Schistosoma haematobium]KAH9594185.1 ribosome-binding protein [Schistosoma haematobium]CAH8439456.1 unnamed protein product [Schistosoma haematobium]CAH8440043.1 unnamed protein product [Schistosoma haematobium]
MADQGLSLILCCKCGVQIYSNTANMCFTCLSSEADIAEHIDRQNTVTFCPKCERYLNPPSNWVSAEPESPELLSLCIKKIRGLKKGLEVRNARFMWTEPHSRRISIEITVQGTLQTGDRVEQQIPINFTVHTQQCTSCTRNAAKDFWNACVQVRQKVDHKKTLLHLEQVILRSGAHKTCSNIKQVSGGIDFFFSTRSQAVTFVNFLSKRSPCRYQTAQHLKSHDVNNNTYNYKYTFSVEIAPVCKNDIVCLSRAQSQKLGGISQLCVVSKVTDAIHLIDPLTCQVCYVDSKAYFSSPFMSITTQKRFSPFVVLEIEEQRDDSSQMNSSKKSYTTSSTSYPVGAKLSQKHSPVSVWVMKDPSNETGLVQLDNESDCGIIHTRSHLGRILHPGDKVLGLDLRNCNINNTEFEKLPEDKIPDIILVLRPSQSKNAAGDKNNGPSKRKRIRKHSLNAADSECDTSTQAVNTNFSSSEDEYVSFGEEDEDETLEFFNMDTSFDEPNEGTSLN